MIVILGATGNVGRPLLHALASAGAPVTAVSRGASPAGLPPGVRHVRADLTDPDTLRAPLTGATAAFLLVSGAGAHLDAPAILSTIKTAGVRRLVLLSSQAAGTRPGSPSHAPLRAIEQTVAAAGLSWTVLRPGGFASNAYAWAPSIREERTVAAPFGDVGLPVIDPQDIAEVAAAVLLGEGHAGRTYELTGPELSTPRDRVRALGDALGAGPIRFVEQTRDEARVQLLGFMPAPVADGTLAILGEPTPAEQRISPDVEKVLGRPPYPFAQWAKRNVTAFQ